MSAPLHFTKMHALGNDFVVINAIMNPVVLSQKLIQAIANRHTGVGFDQLLLITQSQDADFFCRIYNSDGSEAKQCGNGLRCIARFLHEENHHPSRSLTIETVAGIFQATIDDYDHITVLLSEPIIQEKLISLTIHDASFPTSILSTGNPHAIVKVTDLSHVAVNELGPKIAAHAYFQDGANVGFMEIMNDHHIQLRTFERGAGETHACGSNACAAAISGMINGWLKNTVTVQFRYGNLQIAWKGPGNLINMTGPASRVFAGDY